jgi:hypothetical protein
MDVISDCDIVELLLGAGAAIADADADADGVDGVLGVLGVLGGDAIVIEVVNVALGGDWLNCIKLW